jgi:hypothetical protein
MKEGIPKTSQSNRSYKQKIINESQINYVVIFAYQVKKRCKAKTSTFFMPISCSGRLNLSTISWEPYDGFYEQSRKKRKNLEKLSFSVIVHSSSSFKTSICLLKSQIWD